MTAPPLRVLIVDDEALGRQRLEDLLRHEEGVEIAGFADNGDTAIEAIRAVKPDLVFLDVQMPRRTGLEVVRDIGPENMPPTIFVTAYDRYALDAFDVAAVDYLVKPFDDERFEQAFVRARKMIGLTELGKLSERLRTLLNTGVATGGSAAAAPGAVPLATSSLSDSVTTGYLERIAVEMRGQVRVVPVATIEYISASGPYAEIHVGDRTYIIRERMQTLEERLDPGDFFRIHRSVIVKLEQIETLLREAGGDYAVQLRCGARLSVSRNRVEPLEKWMGLAKAR
ncbi:MAG TPA: LytTR family DNA-binding domain-containing protein [Steroidobacteraceae bacterium]|nr:LytTR family DNA-binding domain-containing protein [Steroidobacteraceae bacterium]